MLNAFCSTYIDLQVIKNFRKPYKSTTTGKITCLTNTLSKMMKENPQ
jgi:hypothetical protein